MPFYEYQCKNCGHELEAMQKISEEPLKKCPHCGKSQLQRLISAPVFRLKGGGWYETDFKDDKDKKRNLADRPEAEKPAEKESKPEAQSETAKPAPKPESDSDKGQKPKIAASKPAAKPPAKSPPKKPAAAKPKRAAKKARRR